MSSTRHFCLFGAHVLRRADQRPEFRVQRVLGQRVRHGFGDTEVDDLRHRTIILQRHQDIRWLQIAMDDSLLVGVLNALADLDEQIDPIRNRQLVPRYIIRDRLAADYSITKYGRPCAVAPASNTRAMAGWSISASACRSASKRATTCAVSMPALMTFSAT